MDQYLLAQSEKADSVEALRDCLEQLGELPADASFGFIYATDVFAPRMSDIMRDLKEATGIERWVGSVGVGVCCTGREFYEDPALLLLITDFPEHAVHVFQHSTESQAFRLDPDSLHVAVVHGDPRNAEVPGLIDSLPNQWGTGYLVGGLTSSRSYHFQVANDIVEGELSGVILDAKIPVVTGLTQGCSPIGPVHRLTKCDGHVAVEIDGRSALDVFKEDIGEVLARDLRRVGGYIFAGFPVSGTDTGDYLVRNLTGIDLDEGLIGIGENLEQDSAIMFCRRDGETAVKDLHRMLDEVKQRLPAPPKGGLYFSCLGRGQHMFGEKSREMQYIAESLGDVPLVGFYANGEISGNRLYGYTGVLTIFT